MRIIIADDETRFARLLARILAAEGRDDVETAASGPEALDPVRSKPCDVLVADLRMPGMTGLELLSQVRRISPGTDCILMTAFADVATAREALKGGAVDYLVKPFDNTELTSLVDQIAERRSVLQGPRPDTFVGMVGRSAGMRAVFETMERTAGADATVLILGETGTGKELVARGIHALGPRHRGPFVDVNCAAIPETLIESELFGHEPGAFTGAAGRKAGRLELAGKGTVFLDEIGSMPLGLQPKLLRFLQERTVYRVGGTEAVSIDARVLAATNSDLEAEMRAGRFREDLYYRLAVVTIRLPPLSERAEDTPLLVRHFLRRKGRPEGSITDEAMDLLVRHDWPGNVRELENVVEQAILRAGGDAVDAGHLPDPLGRPERRRGGLDLGSNEKDLIEAALRRAGGNKTRAASLLGITRRKLYSRMKILGMDP
jgi:DNA-binding NtrC family response regulator